MNISATSGPITMKFYQRHQLDRKKAASGFVQDWIDSSHRVIMEKMVLPLSHSCFHPIFIILADIDDMHGSSKEFEIQPDRTTDCGGRCP